MHLGELSLGQPARILSLAPGDAVYRQRLVAMGLIPGTTLTVTRIAPLGDPVEINVRGYALSLRKEEASLIQLAPPSDPFSLIAAHLRDNHE